MHFVKPSAEEYLPASHVTHCEPFGVSLNVPLAQSVHAVALADEYLPARQPEHSAPSLAENWPAEHPVQVEAAASEDFPAEQAEQATAPAVLSEPALQLKQEVAARSDWGFVFFNNAINTFIFIKELAQ